MLAATPLGRRLRLPSRRRSRAPLPIYALPPAPALVEPEKNVPAPRSGELQAIGAILPLVLARYFAPGERS